MDTQESDPMSTQETGTSGKSVEQLQEEFRKLNEQAMEIQARMAALAQQLAERDAKPNQPRPSGKDTVRF